MADADERALVAERAARAGARVATASYCFVSSSTYRSGRNGDSASGA